MKRLIRTSLLLLTVFVSSISYSQNLVQSRVANLVSGDYTTSGTVYLEVFDNNTLNVRFDNDYSTQSNVFDVHVFLTNSTNYASPINVSNDFLIANIGTISGLDYSSGAMTFPIPSSVSIEDYDHIVLVCLSFGQLHWAHGDFSTYTIPTLPNFSESCQATPATPTLNVTGSPNINGIPDISFPITTLGTTPVTWTFDDGSGNYASTVQNIIVTELVVLVSQSQNNLTATQTPTGTTYQWIDCDNGNVPVSGETGSTFTAIQEGNYAVIANVGACIDTSSCHFVSFDDIYDAPTLSDINAFCEATPMTPSITLNNGTVLDGVPDVSFPISNIGTTPVTWTFNSGSGSSLISQQNVTIQALNSSISQNGNILDATPTATNISFQWIDCDDNYAPILGETASTFTATQEGNYAVITASGNCSDTSSCVTVSFANITDLSNELNVRLFPNPSNGDFIILFDETTENVQLEISDLSGRIIQSRSYDSVMEIHVSINAQASSYFVMLKTPKSTKVLRYLKK